MRVVLFRNQFSTPPASAVRPKKDVVTVQTTSQGGPLSRIPIPLGFRVNIKGTMKAGSVYFQACRVVLYGFPPVRAAAAKHERAVGGETSERMA